MLINKELLKKYSPFPRNYDLTEVMNYVDIAEKIWLIPCLGYPLYEELLQQVRDNEVTPENATLLVEAVYPYLGFCVAYEALPLCWVHISEVGLTLGSSENSQSATLKDLTLVLDHLRKQVEARKTYLIEWVCSHSQYFPLICGCGCECSSCCGGGDAELAYPNPRFQLYSTCKPCTDLI